MASIDSTPLRTKLLNGHDTNVRLGSSKMTSIDGSWRRTYFAAVAPPQPPPTTTTRRAGFRARSPLPEAAQPARTPPAPAPNPTPAADTRKKSLRVNSVIATSVATWRGGVVKA